MKDNTEVDFFEEEIRCGFQVTEKKKHVWAVELDLMEKLKDVCERNHLRFFMSGGTLLGAVRHRGFIPWDDDADFLMPREDFEKLKKIAPREITPPYFFQTEESDPDIFHGGFARLINCNTTGIVQLNIGHAGKFGIWIDISILDNIFEDKNQREKQIKRIRYYQRLLFAKTYRELKCLLGLTRFEWTVYKILAAFSNRTRICGQLKKAMTCCRSSDYAACFTYHHDRYQPLLYEWGDYRDTVLFDFESVKLPAPIGYDRRLQVQYGDYMQYPPEDERGTVRTVIIDPFIPYDSFLLNFDQIDKGLKNKTVVIFGAGQMLEHYLQNEGKKNFPVLVVDNNPEKWGTEIHGIPVKPPDTLIEVHNDKLQIIICSIYYREIAKQLREMGLDRYYIYVQELAWL